MDNVTPECEHDSNGGGYHFVTWIGGPEDRLIPNTGQTQEELEALDKQLRKEGKYLSGGCVSCSKCGEPFYPNLYFS